MSIVLIFSKKLNYHFTNSFFGLLFVCLFVFLLHPFYPSSLHHIFMIEPMVLLHDFILLMLFVCLFYWCVCVYIWFWVRFYLFVCLFTSYCFSYLLFTCLFWFSFVVWSFCIFFLFWKRNRERERDNTQSWIGRDIGKIWEVMGEWNEYAQLYWI